MMFALKFNVLVCDDNYDDWTTFSRPPDDTNIKVMPTHALWELM